MTKSQKMITLDEEIIEQLKDVPNVSALINQMLIDYFNSTKELSELFKEKQKSIETQTEELSKIQSELNEQNKKEEERKKEIQEQQDKYWNSDERWEKHKLIIEEAFDTYNFPKERKEDLLNEYILLMKNRTIKNLIEFMEIRGFEKKVKQNE